MLDTVVLSIPQDKFRIKNHKIFSPSSEGLFQFPYLQMGGRRYIKCIYNPPKSAGRNGVYLPRLTLIKAVRKGYFEIALKIEFSVPKLFFGNNFDELENDNFLRCVRLLSRALYQMDIEVGFEDLEHASVSVIHYSKNFHLTNHTSCSMILNELRNLDLSKRIDIGEERFLNGGHALHFHTSSRDIVFYDKIKDLEQFKISSKRSIEKDNEIQLSLFDEFPNPRALQVIRMEIRFGNRREIKKILERINCPVELTFSNLFNNSISKKVLTYFWNEIEEKKHLLNFKTEGVFDIAESIKSNNPELKVQKILELVGSIILRKEGGDKRLRSFLGYEGSLSANRKWYNLRKKFKTVKYDKDGNFQAINNISEKIQSFESLKFQDYLNND